MFKSLARAQITGQTVGMLKMLFHRETLEILGIHCFGANASEIIHIGQAIMSQPGDGQLADVLHQHDVQLPDDGRSVPRGGAERLQPVVLNSTRAHSARYAMTAQYHVRLTKDFLVFSARIHHLRRQHLRAAARAQLSRGRGGPRAAG